MNSQCRGYETEMQIKARKEISVSVSSILTLDYFAGLITQVRYWSYCAQWYCYSSRSPSLQCALYPWDVIMTNQQLKTNAGKGILRYIVLELLILHSDIDAVLTIV